MLNAGRVFVKSLKVSWALNTGWTWSEYILLIEAGPQIEAKSQMSVNQSINQS